MSFEHKAILLINFKKGIACKMHRNWLSLKTYMYFVFVLRMYMSVYWDKMLSPQFSLH